MTLAVMIDCKTWGTRAGCAIRSIGAVAFDPASEEIGSGPIDKNIARNTVFYQNVTTESCVKFKLHVDADTLKWWAQQSPEAEAMLHKDQVHLKSAILNFNTWFRCVNPEDIDGTRVWSHGEAFDIPIYEFCAHAVGFKAPWHYRSSRDTRTLFDLTGFSTKDAPSIGVEHNALDDAVHQARCVQLAMKKLNEHRIFPLRYGE